MANRPKHNPKLNPSKPLPRLDLGGLKKEAQAKGFNWLTWAAVALKGKLELFTDHKMKTLDISGRQFRKAVKGKKK